jgi:hypothetical protein
MPANPIDQYVSTKNPAKRSPSQPSLVSRTSEKSGLSTKEPAFIKSKWGIGWQTPTLMLSSYVLGTKNKSMENSMIFSNVFS